MNLDDRLRAAHRSQLNEVTAQVDTSVVPGPGSSPTGSYRVLALVAVLLLGVVGFWAASSLGGGPQGSQVESGGIANAGNDGSVAVPTPPQPTPSPAPDDQLPVAAAEPTLTPTPEVWTVDPQEPTPNMVTPEASVTPDGEVVPVSPTAVTAVETVAPTPESPGVTTPTDGPTSGPTPATTPTLVPTVLPTPTEVPTALPTATTTPTATATPTVTPTPVPRAVSVGVPNSVCPSGARAELELASLRYVGENTGWDRMQDLVDEQDGPYYFLAWEPNYPDSVTVEIVLSEAVRVADIRVVQDPFKSVSGTITLGVNGVDYPIELSGMNGWKVQTFPSNSELRQFTINRNDPASDIMEVLVCVATAP